MVPGDWRREEGRDDEPGVCLEGRALLGVFQERWACGFGDGVETAASAVFVCADDGDVMLKGGYE